MSQEVIIITGKLLSLDERAPRLDKVVEAPIRKGNNNNNSKAQKHIKFKNHEKSINQSIGMVMNSNEDEPKHLTLKAKFSNNGKIEIVQVLIDSGATGNFIDSRYVQSMKLETFPIQNPINVLTIDGRLLSSGAITCQSKIEQFYIDNHVEDLTLNVINSPSYHIILGLPWLQKHNPSIDWKLKTIEFPSVYCKQYCKDFESNEIMIPREYKNYQSVFSSKQANTLPPHRPYDLTIDLIPNAKPRSGRVFELSENELRILRDYISEQLEKGFIRPSKSPYGFPLFFVPKKDGSVRPVVDYRELNKVTISNSYPLPLISEILNRLAKAKIYSKLDLKGAYNLVRIKEGDEYKTTFVTKYGSYEYLVMPFGLKNAPACFQNMMNHIFKDILDKYCVVYLDDILVYSDNLEEHINHVKNVLNILQNNNLCLKLEKCEFHKDMVDFLGYRISSSGITMDPSKLTSILQWDYPKSKRDIQVFLGFANFYRRFIKDYSLIAKPLTDSLKDSERFECNEGARKAMDELKNKFTTAPILIHPNLEKQFFIEADASDYAIGSVLMQIGNDNELHPIAFYSRKASPAEINYTIHDKELLAIKASFEEWRHFLIGTIEPVIVYSDHKNLEYFLSSRKLNRRQARWVIFLADFNFKICFRSGTSQTQADALSRQSSLRPKDGDDVSSIQENPLISKSQILNESINATLAISSVINNFKELLKESYQEDELFKRIKNGEKQKNYSIKDNMLYYKDKLVVSSSELQVELLKQYHDSPTSGHLGRKRTMDLISRHFWFPRMKEIIHRYVKTCEICQRIKASRHKPYGLLVQRNIPARPWLVVTLDFITDLPVSSGYSSILTVVDTFSKMAHFIPCSGKNVSAKETTILFLNNIIRIHGIPEQVISDRGPQFASRFWKELFLLLGTKVSLSSAYHPQSDGQSERVNQIIEQYLRAYVNYQQNNWVSYLTLAEIAYNNAMQESIRTSPFYCNYAFHPKFDFLLGNPVSITSSLPNVQDIASRLQSVYSRVSQSIQRSLELQKKQSDKKRLEPPQLQVGDLVMLNAKNIKTLRPCAKLDFKKLGPFKLLRKINNVTWKLQLPPSMKLSNSFHISLLEPYHASTFIDRPAHSSYPIIVDDQEEYAIEYIVDSRIKDGKLQYLVHWLGYPESERSWEPKENLVTENCQNQRVNEFHENFPNKPGPL